MGSKESYLPTKEGVLKFARRAGVAAFVSVPLAGCGSIYDFLGIPTKTVDIRCEAGIKRELLQNENGEWKWTIIADQANENCTSKTRIKGTVPTTMPVHKDWPK